MRRRAPENAASKHELGPILVHHASASGAKLFAILLFLGAVAVLITSVLGYIRARDALEETIYNQLTAARQIQGAPS